MQAILDSISVAIERKNWYVALISSLVLPDMCSKLENPTLTTKDRYPVWFEKYLKSRYENFLTGTDCYALRCSFLHEGSEDISHQSAREVLDRIKFVSEGSHLIRVTNCFSGDAKHDGRAVLLLSAKQFCLDLVFAAKCWLDEVKDDDEIQKRIDQLLQIHEDGTDISGVHNDLLPDLKVGVSIYATA